LAKIFKKLLFAAAYYNCSLGSERTSEDQDFWPPSLEMTNGGSEPKVPVGLTDGRTDGRTEINDGFSASGAKFE